MVACEGAGHAEEILQHQLRNMGFQQLFSAAWIINLEVYNLLQRESCGTLPISCQLHADFLQLLEFLTCFLLKSIHFSAGL